MSGWSSARVVDEGGQRLVERAAGPWTPTVHRLLEHVAEKGVGGIPAPIGIDDEIERVTVVEGEVPNYPMPAWVWLPGILIAAARWTREFHDATVDFEHAAGEHWRFDGRPGDVVCHNDLGPHNFAFSSSTLVGVIDFDAAVRGSRAWDLAGLAYRLVPFTRPENPVDSGFSLSERRDRLRILARAYGADMGPASIAIAIPERLRTLAAVTAARAEHDPALVGHAEQYRADAAWFEQHLPMLIEVEQTD